jgi:murein DD-endopeptidase MepM/ murein hydrolase activator NlpD
MASRIVSSVSNLSRLPSAPTRVALLLSGMMLLLGLSNPGVCAVWHENSGSQLAPLIAHHHDLLDRDVDFFSLATSHVARRDSGLRAGAVSGTLSRTLHRIDLPARVRAQLGQVLAGRVDLHARARHGDRYRIAFDHASRAPRLTALDLRIAGRALRVLWFKPPGHARGAYYTFDGAPLAAKAVTLPVIGARMSSPFGVRMHPLLHRQRMHSGVDLAAPRGTRVVATRAGVVSFVGYERGGYGRHVVITHANGWQTCYAHLSAYARGVRKGARVAQGQAVGAVGATGAATGPHLHFEVRIAGRPVDPLTALAGGSNTFSPRQRYAFAREVTAARERLASADTPAMGLATADTLQWFHFLSADEATPLPQRRRALITLDGMLSSAMRYRA